MRITTHDSISMNDVKDTEATPVIIDGDLEICFESEVNKNGYSHVKQSY